MVDGQYPEPVEVVSLSTDLQVFYFRWCRISSINSMLVYERVPMVLVLQDFLARLFERFGCQRSGVVTHLLEQSLGFARLGYFIQ